MSLLVKWINEKGQLHREDGPAAYYSDGSEAWYVRAIAPILANDRQVLTWNISTC